MTADQLPFELGDLAAPPPGLVERSYRRAVAAATRQDDDGPPAAVALDDTDAGLVGLALALARAVDLAAAKKDVRGVALVAKELRETSTRLRLDPTARGTVNDPIAALFAELGTPSAVDHGRSGPALGDAP